MKLYLALIAIAELMCLVSGQCVFTQNALQHETRVVFISRNGRFELFNETIVPVHTTLKFFCNNNNIIDVVCTPGNQFSPNVPINNCPKNPVATVEKVRDLNCGFDAYAVGYWIRQTFLEIYRSCYDTCQMRATMSTHVVFPGLKPQRPEKTFTGDGIVSLADGNTFKADQVFSTFEKLLGPRQNYITSKNVLTIDRGHLSPSGDFGFGTLQRGTFKYINVVPQFKKLNTQTWKKIEIWIRQHADTYGKIRVLTGAFEVLKIRDNNHKSVSMYLAEPTSANKVKQGFKSKSLKAISKCLPGIKRNPIPKWMFKAIIDDRGVFLAVVIVYNNIYNTKPAAPCRTTTCPSSLLSRGPDMSSIYCCDPNDFKSNVLPNVLRINKYQ